MDASKNLLGHQLATIDLCLSMGRLQLTTVEDLSNSWLRGSRAALAACSEVGLPPTDEQTLGARVEILRVASQTYEETMEALSDAWKNQWTMLLQMTRNARTDTLPPAPKADARPAAEDAQAIAAPRRRRQRPA